MPAPASDAMVFAPSVRLSVAPASTVTALLVLIELPPAKASVPALTVTEPVCVLVPVRVRVPAPCLVKAPLPEMMPDRVTAALFSTLPPRCRW